MSQVQESPAPGVGSLGFWRLFPKVVASQSLPGGHHRLTVREPKLACAARPGQFVHIWCHPREEIVGPAPQALLRRPLSIARRPGRGSFELVFKVAGAGTRFLASRQPGERLDLLGPLGNGFSLSGRGSTALLVGGGIGVAPLLGLAEALVKNKVEVILAAGAKSDRSFPLPISRRRRRNRPWASLPDLDSLGCRTFFVSEEKERLLISQWLERNLGKVLPTDKGCSVFAVGPWAMMQKVAEIAGRRGLGCQVSLEERMACGLGACRSCVVRLKSARGAGDEWEFKTVCRDGPVFPAERVIWEKGRC